MTNPAPDQPANNIKKLTVTQMFLVWLLPIPFAIPIAFSKDHSRAATWYSRIILSLLALVFLSAIFGSNPKGTSPNANRNSASESASTNVAEGNSVPPAEETTSESLPGEFDDLWISDQNCKMTDNVPWLKIHGSSISDSSGTYKITKIISIPNHDNAYVVYVKNSEKNFDSVLTLIIMDDEKLHNIDTHTDTERVFTRCN